MINFGNWSVDLSHPALMILTILLILSCIFCLKAVATRLYQRNRARALSVMLLNLIAFSSVFVLLLQPVNRHQSEETVILLTDGFDTGLYPLSPAAKVYWYSENNLPETEKLPANTSKLSHIAQLNLKEPALGRIQVEGHGLSEAQWRNFSTDIEIDFQPPSVTGFVDIHWPRSLIIGETFVINGTYLPSEPDAVVDIRLLDPTGAMVDSTRIIGGQSFSLQAKPKARGNISYSIQAFTADSLQTRQPVPISIQASPPISIMIKQSAPSFDTRQLREYAAVLGHRVLTNTTISKAKSISQTSNFSENADAGVSPQTLASIDILIMDGRALMSLDSKDQRWIEDAITGGLGLIVMADSSLLESPPDLQNGLLSGFRLEPTADIELESIPRLLSDQAAAWQSPLPTRALSLKGSDAETLVDDGFGRSLVSTRPMGLGNVAINLITHSSQWLTSGNRADWAELWSSLLETLARQPEDSRLLAAANTTFHRPNQRVGICALGGEKPLQVSVTTAEPPTVLKLDLSKDMLNSERLCAFFWPGTPGWQRIELFADDTGDLLDKSFIYVFENELWKAQRQYNQTRATLSRVNGTQHSQVSDQKWTSEPVGYFWPWLILVMTAFLLWLERKLDFSDQR